VRRLLVLQVAALGESAGFHSLETVFPAVTCTVQASFRTASPPSAHGVVSNGLFFRDLRKVMFWEQAASLVKGKRIWDGFRGGVGMMFWQQSLGESVDLVLSPAPIHKHGGGMFQDCYCKPAGLYQKLCETIGRPFDLLNYWGPLANRKSSDWILAATLEVMESEAAPGLLFSYLPHLDYDLQRYGPDSAPGRRALDVVGGYLDRVEKHAVEHGYDFVIFGDYAIEPVTRPVIFPNRRLRERGLFASRTVGGRTYPDFYSSKAFAVADHQIARVYGAVEEAKKALRDLPGVETLLDDGEDIILIAEEGAWFAYPWWDDEKPPDFASHVDIHNKPGYDPCELFFGWPGVSSDVTRLRGTHGRPGKKTAWKTSVAFPSKPGTLLELAAAVRDHLEK